MTNYLTALGRMVQARFGQQPDTYTWTDRQNQYSLWENYYDNNVYASIADGGQRDYINLALGNAAAADISGLYNPVSAVVDLYLHTLAGNFGDEITVDNQALIEPLKQIWQWSNINIEKQNLCRYAAKLGCCGLRVVARNNAIQTKRRVYIKVEHPSVIRDVQMDDRGNVEAIQLEYPVTRGLAEEQEIITIREELTPDRIRTWRVDGSLVIPFDLTTMEDGGEFSDYDNPFGLVPYVILRHEQDGTPWGRNAFYRVRTPLDRLNALASHIDVEIHRHVRATWLIAAAGKAPEKFTFDDLSVLYVNNGNGASNPFAQAMVADLNLAGALGQAKQQQEWIEDALPELKATQGKYLSGQSGDTIAALRKPAEDRLSLARDNYEDALVRAQKIAISCGIVYELWELGTGTGTREAADAAYTQGKEDHKFNKRPLLGTEAAQPTQATPQATTGRQTTVSLASVGDKVAALQGRVNGTAAATNGTVTK